MWITACIIKPTSTNTLKVKLKFLCFLKWREKNKEILKLSENTSRLMKWEFGQHSTVLYNFLRKIGVQKNWTLLAKSGSQHGLNVFSGHFLVLWRKNSYWEQSMLKINLLSHIFVCYIVGGGALFFWEEKRLGFSPCWVGGRDNRIMSLLAPISAN